jgi:hypothetical protein
MRPIAALCLVAALAVAAPDNLPSDCWLVTHFDFEALWIPRPSPP